LVLAGIRADILAVKVTLDIPAVHPVMDMQDLRATQDLRDSLAMLGHAVAWDYRGMLEVPCQDHADTQAAWWWDTPVQQPAAEELA
jgi:hypothetical protein